MVYPVIKCGEYLDEEQRRKRQWDEQIRKKNGWR